LKSTQAGIVDRWVERYHASQPRQDTFRTYPRIRSALSVHLYAVERHDLLSWDSGAVFFQPTNGRLAVRPLLHDPNHQTSSAINVDIGNFSIYQDLYQHGGRFFLRLLNRPWCGNMSYLPNSPPADKDMPTSITIDNLEPQDSSEIESIPRHKAFDTEAQYIPTTTTNQASIGPEQNNEDVDYSDNSNVPKMAYLRLFWFFFYNFGLFAWGGPVAQIALIKEKLVIQDKWITLPRFQRAFSVYQILPGPEAAELCMFFGCLSAGRIGGVVAGIAFILPGFVLMLLASYLYSLAGFENKYFNASFRALQPIVAAMVCLEWKWPFLLDADVSQILRATHKIAEHSIVRKDSRKLDPFLVLAAILTFVNCAMRINMYGLFHVTRENWH
jgi:chromate transport protein ChrA